MAFSRQVRRSLALALLGLAAGLGLVAALVGGWDAVRRTAGWTGSAPPAVTAPAPEGGERAPAGPGGGPGASAGKGPADGPASVGPAPVGPPPGRTSAAPPGAAPEAPSFDIVRVEPNGDAVVAGRGAPNTVVELLVDGKPVAKALADTNGQFAIVPPALPAGSSEIRLRATGADGRETRSTQTVAVAVSERRDRKPLVALTAPDRPTVVLSQPGAPEPAGQPGPQAAQDGSADPKAGRKAGTVKPAPARVVSVDAQEGGRLFVTGAGTPGASVRLYLNDTLVAPGSVGPDGTVTFTIGRGVKPGRYQVRIDQIEPGTDRVRSRAEVPFAVPEPARIAAREAPAAGGPGETGTGPGAGPGAPTARSEPRPVVEGRAAPTGAAPTGAAPTGAAPTGAAPTGLVPARPEAGHAAAPGAAAWRDPAPPSPGPRAPGPAAPEAGPGRPGAVFVPEISTAKISRGDNLWRISTRTYGRGERYTVIFDANQDQIRDPDLIYPGQIFVLPADKRG